VLSIEFSLPSDAPLFAKMIGKISVQEGTIRGSAGKQLLLTRNRLQEAIDSKNIANFRCKPIGNKWFITLGCANKATDKVESDVFKDTGAFVGLMPLINAYGPAMESLLGCVTSRIVAGMNTCREVVLYPVARGKDGNLLIDRELSLVFTVDILTGKTLSVGITREIQDVSR